MNSHSKIAERTSSLLIKRDPHALALKVFGRDSVAIKGGTSFADRLFAENTSVPKIDYVPGADYVVAVHDGVVGVSAALAIPDDGSVLGGFHFAPGGNAAAREGGDSIPAINPCSLWDLTFRPGCPDPRGMVLVTTPSGKFWADIYLTGANAHADGTSKFGVTIADGDDRPLDAKGKKYKNFNYETACAVMAAHGKGLLSVEEFFAAAYGVTEKTAAKRDPNVTGLDAPRTSKFGLMQATGNMLIWGHDGDPDQPRASLFGGSWFSDGYAGSRYASVGLWSGNSVEDLGARGRSDHLQLD